MAARENRLAIVLGMHRSGTSAVTRGLAALGYSLGDHLMPPVADNNPKGFWEDRDLNRINVQVLAALGRDWDAFQPMGGIDGDVEPLVACRLQALALLRSRLDEQPAFAMKDPRMARLMAFWSPLLERLSSDCRIDFVLAVRNPLSVALSLQRRDGFERIKSYYLWLGHMLDAYAGVLSQIGREPGAGNATAVVVDFDQLMDAPQQQLARLADRLGLPFEAASAAVAEYTGAFLDEALRHSMLTPSDLQIEPHVPADVCRVFELFAAASADQVSLWSDEFRSSMQECNARYRMLAPLLEHAWKSGREAARLHKAVEQRARTITELQRNLGASEQKVEALRELMESGADSRRLLDQSTQREQEAVRQLAEQAELVRGLREEVQRGSQAGAELAAALEAAEARVLTEQARNDELRAESRQLQQLHATLERRIEELQAEARAKAVADQLRIRELENLSARAHQSSRELAELSRRYLAEQDMVTSLRRERDLLSSHLRSRSRVPGVREYAYALVRNIAGFGRVFSRKGRRELAAKRIIARSDLFDPDWYVNDNPDVLIAGMDPLEHFVRFGACERRAPGPGFDTAWYLATNPDVAESGINPLAHYLLHGRSEGRLPCPASK